MHFSAVLVSTYLGCILHCLVAWFESNYYQYFKELISQFGIVFLTCFSQGFCSSVYHTA